jgi:hypothetical protein
MDKKIGFSGSYAPSEGVLRGVEQNAKYSKSIERN